MEHWEHKELLSMIIANNNEEEADRLINEEDILNALSNIDANTESLARLAAYIVERDH